MSDGEAKDLKAAFMKWALGIIATGIIGFGGTALTFYSSVQADQARSEEVHRRLESDIVELNAATDGHTQALADIAGDVSSLKAVVESGQRDELRRLQRIEAAIDRIQTTRHHRR